MKFFLPSPVFSCTQGGVDHRIAEGPKGDLNTLFIMNWEDRPGISLRKSKNRTRRTNGTKEI